jgi:predicted HAD superfamily Cof-like phosphohydrolase
MSKTMYDKVFEFREHIGLPVSREPRLLPSEQASFYARFLMEELSEFLRAHEHGDIVDAADALADLVYVALGAAHHMGLPMDRIFDAVHDANMSKSPGSTKRRGLGQDAAKPSDWVGPEGVISLLISQEYYD